jgi:hypothetical protein
MPTETPVLSFDAPTKRKFVARAKAHQLADQIVKGQYWEDGKGCAVGCLVHGDSHQDLADQLGIPLQMAFLIDLLFEGMPVEQSKIFPLRFVQAIPTGKDLEPVMDRFFLALLSDPTQGVMLSANDSVKDQIQAIIDLYTRQVALDYPSVEEWRAAARAAYRAADSAAYSAASSAAYRAADRAADRAAYSAASSAAYRAADSAASRAAYRAAARAAYSAADRAAYSAADSAAYRAADRAAYRAAADSHFLWQAVLLISLLESA